MSQNCPEIVPGSVLIERRITLITNDRNAMRRAKTARINVRMTEAQRRVIERRADDAGMAPSSYMRETAILADEKPISPAAPGASFSTAAAQRLSDASARSAARRSASR